MRCSSKNMGLRLCGNKRQLMINWSCSTDPNFVGTVAVAAGYGGGGFGGGGFGGGWI